MRKILRIGFLLCLAFVATACRKPQPVIAKPHGLELPALPTVGRAPEFLPEGGHYAELLLRDGQWQAFVDGKSAADFEDEDQLYGFLKSFKAREEREGRPAVVLVSAEGHAPLSEVKIPIRTAASCGINKLYLHVRPSAVAGPESLSYHSLVLDFICLHCRFAKYKLDSEPLVIAIEENGSLRRKIDGSLSRLDDSEAPGDLAGLDSILRNFAERIRSDNSAPWVRVHLGEETPYQRFIDVLCRLHVHGLEPELFPLSDLSEPECE